MLLITSNQSINVLTIAVRLTDLLSKKEEDYINCCMFEFGIKYGYNHQVNDMKITINSDMQTSPIVH